MDLGLRDSVAVIIGGASGIGKAIATAFVNEKTKVALLDVSTGVSAVAAELGGEGWVVDAADCSAVSSAAADVRVQLGRVDHVVFAAGVGSGKFGFPFWSLDPSDWERVLRVNLIGAANVAHAFAPGLAEQKRGTMLFLASVAGQIGSQTDPPYSASKAGLINFAQCAAKDFAQFGVRVNCLCPGMVQTPLNRSVWRLGRPATVRIAARLRDVDRREDRCWCRSTAGKRPKIIAAMAAVLASDRAANITGQTVNVDGGYVMHR